MDTTQKGAGYAWRNFIFIFLCGVSFAISLMVVPAGMGMLIEYFQCSASEAGWFMSFTSVAGTVIAFFTAPIQAKIGPKNMVLLGMACIIIGDAICLFATDVTLFYVGRFIFGLANGLLATAAPTLIAILFRDPSKRGLPNSVWALWIPIGQIIIMLLFAYLVSTFGGWQAAFAFALIFAAAATVCCFFFITIPKERQMEAVAGKANVKISDAFKSPSVILCFLMVLFFAFAMSCYSSFAPTYYQMAGGMGLAEANNLNSIGTFAGIVGSLVVGVILGKVTNQPMVLFGVWIFAGIAMGIAFMFIDPALIIATCIAWGLLSNMIMPAVFTNVEWATPDPSVIGAAFGLLAIASNGGGIPAAPIVGALVDATGNWMLCCIPPAIASVLGIVCAAIFFAKRGPVCVRAMMEKETRAKN